MVVDQFSGNPLPLQTFVLFLLPIFIGVGIILAIVLLRHRDFVDIGTLTALNKSGRRALRVLKNGRRTLSVLKKNGRRTLTALNKIRTTEFPLLGKGWGIPIVMLVLTISMAVTWVFIAPLNLSEEEIIEKREIYEDMFWSIMARVKGFI